MTIKKNPKKSELSSIVNFEFLISIFNEDPFEFEDKYFLIKTVPAPQDTKEELN